MTSVQQVLAGRYRLESLLASGGMGTVWCARDEVLTRVVAVKTLHDHLAEDEAFLVRFHGEALSAARLTHPNIISIYDTGTEEDTDTHYIVMEYCSGGSLGALLEEKGPLQPDHATRITAAICEALGYAHDHGVIHRDVKPANVLLADERTVKVGDFGIAKAAFTTGDVTTTGAILGTVTHISPEQARGDEPDPRSDLYSLGIVLFEMMTGRPPFSASSPVATAMQHVQKPPPAPRSIRADIPRPLEAVILKALEKDPDDRFQSAEEFGAALGSGRSIQTAAIPIPREIDPDAEHAVWPSLRPLVPVLIFIAAAIGVGLAASSLIDQQNGGTNGGGGDGGGRAITPALVVDFDPPPGDGNEHPELVPYATDGDAGSEWTTETYESELSLLKPGVGLLFDLGSSQQIVRVRVLTTQPGYSFQLLAGDTIPSGPDELDVITEVLAAGADERVELDGTEARFWVVWITDLPPGGKAEIAEVEFVAS